MARYDDEFRASAVLMLQAAGYPDRKGALTQVAAKLGIPQYTLTRWHNRTSNPPPLKLVKRKKEELVELILSEAYNILREMKDARPDADYRALATAFGIMIDKFQLLSGEATERVEMPVSWKDVVLKAREEHAQNGHG